jgi:hypothetical protein
MKCQYEFTVSGHPVAGPAVLLFSATFCVEGTALALEPAAAINPPAVSKPRPITSASAPTTRVERALPARLIG